MATRRVELLGNRLGAEARGLAQWALPRNGLRNHRDRLLSRIRLRRFWLVRHPIAPFPRWRPLALRGASSGERAHSRSCASIPHFERRLPCEPVEPSLRKAVAESC